MLGLAGFQPWLAAGRQGGRSSLSSSLSAPCLSAYPALLQLPITQTDWRLETETRDTALVNTAVVLASTITSIQYTIYQYTIATLLLVRLF